MSVFQRLKCLKKGQVLEVLTDYDGALELRGHSIFLELRGRP
jgi:TusA-related sulfurtransferase